MKTSKLTILAVAGSLWASSAFGLTYTFSDNDFVGGSSWGTMNIDVADQNTLKISYTGNTFTAPYTAANSYVVNGFGFFFGSYSYPNINSSVLPSSLTNSSTNGNTNLDWYLLTKLDAIPTAANIDQFSDSNIAKNDKNGELWFTTGATTDESGKNFNNKDKGITAGATDEFFLNFSAVNFSTDTFDLNSFVHLTGIRLQSLPDSINGGSLFLIGEEGGGGGFDTPVPEPGTVALVGLGLAGLAFYTRRKKM